jgi:hypothetical protein
LIVKSSVKPNPISAAFAGGLIFMMGAAAVAHVNWTQVNGPHPDLAVVYSFSETGPLTVDTMAVAPGLGQSPDLALVPALPNPTTASIALTSTDVVSAPFGPRSLLLPSRQILDTTATVGTLPTTGPLTIEGWLKWPTGFDSASLTFGFRSGARILVTRDVNNPANDRFGVAATHGSYVSAPGFTNWVDVGTEEAPIGDWIHVAVTLSVEDPIYFEPATNHDHYTTGTLARFFLNGHLVGPTNNTAVNVGGAAGLQLHNPSRVRVGTLSGGNVLVDEVAIWNRDWSANGTVLNAFDNGRVIPAAVQDWAMYE